MFVLKIGRYLLAPKHLILERSKSVGQKFQGFENLPCQNLATTWPKATSRTEIKQTDQRKPPKCYSIRAIEKREMSTHGCLS